MNAIIKKAINKQFFFVLTGANGRVIATGETYKRKATLKKTLNKYFNAFKVKDLVASLAILFTMNCAAQVQVVNLDGSASSDPDGSIVGWQWTAATTNPSATVFGTPTAAKTTVVPAGGVQWTAGVYKFILVVTDNLGAKSAPDTMQVTFKVNTVPKANAGQDQTITYNSTAIGGIDKPSDVAVNWRKLYGRSAVIQEPNKAITNVTNLQRGLYVFEKTVTNSAGSSRDWVYVYVKTNTTTLKAF